MLNFLPKRIANAVQHLNLNRLYEIRLRADKPLLVNYCGKFDFLGKNGLCGANSAILPTYEEVEETLFAASGKCLYSVENQLKQGFLTAECGERIGVAGSFTYEGERVLSVRAVKSLCIRIPHEIFGCAEHIYEKCFDGEIRSVLLMSPPGGGKTTILRELSRLVCERTQKNVLVCDERGELSAGDTGMTSDVIRFCDKKTAFTAGIRALRPEVIVTDELSREDYLAVERAVQSGICVLASAHLTRVEDVPQKFFSRYVLLKGLGEIEDVICG